MAAETDTLGRRRRVAPRSTGKRITPQPADLLWFRKLAEHGPLPSSYLLAFTRQLRRSDKRTTERLTDLFHETNTPDGGRYLDRPAQQFRTIDARYNQLVYDLTPAGIQALRSTGLPAIPSKTSGPWLHRHMVACTTASIELATRDRSDLSFIPGHQILARAKTELRAAVPVMDPENGRSKRRDLIPDALFGLSYHTKDGDRFRFFAVECDRATEPVMSRTWSRKSWRRGLRQYQAYIAGGRYRAHLQLTAPLLVLNVVTDERRLKMLLGATERELGATSYQLFQSWPAFGSVFRPPVPCPALLQGAWRRAGRPAFCIAEV
ncbi:MAG: replication-relaxation family protein [Pseudomonadota bacterium]